MSAMPLPPALPLQVIQAAGARQSARDGAAGARRRFLAQGCKL